MPAGKNGLVVASGFLNFRAYAQNAPDRSARYRSSAGALFQGKEITVIGEFEEIAHCGGKVTFRVRDEAGRRSIQFSFSHQSPTPASLFAVYALPQGVPVGDCELGGIGSPMSAPPMSGCFPVLIASDSQGMFGGQCFACNGYWRSRSPSRSCPYCAARAAKFQFLTDSHVRYVEQYMARLEEALASELPSDHVIDMDAVAAAAGKAGAKPQFYYAEESQQNKFKCAACRMDNDILGRFGYCAFCATRNDLGEFERDMEALRSRIVAGDPSSACVRDGVAAFDALFTQYSVQLQRRVPLSTARRNRMARLKFHRVTSASSEMRQTFDINILDNINAEDVAFADRLFLRRHVYEHNGGEVDQRYLDESADTSVRLKQVISETADSAHKLRNILLRMAGNLHQGFHEILPPLSH
jgi:hypothetical protein